MTRQFMASSLTENEPRHPLRRRSLLLAGAAAAMGLGPTLTPAAFGQGVKAKAPVPAGRPHAALIAAVSRCNSVGTACLDHCIRLTRRGDTSLADCLRNVRQMLVVCGALGRLASLDARRVKDQARVCLDVCTECEAECRKHESHHAQCKACAEACAAMLVEIRKTIAA